MEIIARRIYSHADDANVLNSTTVPIKRGTTSPVLPYKIKGNNVGVTLAWNSITLSKCIEDFTSKVENDIENVLVEDNNAYPGLQNVNGQQKLSPVTFKLVQYHSEAGTPNYLAALEPYVNASTYSDLVLKVCRRHASDYIQITWKNVYLKQFKPDVTPISDGAAVHYVNALWSEPTDIIVVHSQYDTAGAAVEITDADYEVT